MRSVYSE